MGRRTRSERPMSRGAGNHFEQVELYYEKIISAQKDGNITYADSWNRRS